MEWGELGFAGLGWAGLAWDGLARDGMVGNGMECDGMGWNGMERHAADWLCTAGCGDKCLLTALAVDGVVVVVCVQCRGSHKGHAVKDGWQRMSTLLPLV